MNPESIVQWLAPLSLEARARALNVVSWMLTLSIRYSWLASVESGGDPSSLIKKIVGVNELQHIVLTQTGHYLACEEHNTYTLEAFGRMLCESAARNGTVGALASAIRNAQERGIPPAGNASGRHPPTPAELEDIP